MIGYWPALAWLAACLCTILGYTIGRAFQREEHISMQLENIHLRGSLDREAIRARAAEETLRQLQAKVSLEGLRQVSERAAHVRVDNPILKEAMERVKAGERVELEPYRAIAEGAGQHAAACLDGAGQLGEGAGDPTQTPKPSSLPSNSER